MTTIANLCLLVACLLPIACASLAKSKGFGKSRREGGYDNHAPREWATRLQGWQARANAAQMNSFEALPVFIAGVLVAQQAHAPQRTVDALAVAFVLLRVAYVAAYVGDRAMLRSGLWTLALGCCVALFFVG